MRGIINVQACASNSLILCQVQHVWTWCSSQGHWCNDGLGQDSTCPLNICRATGISARQGDPKCQRSPSILNVNRVGMEFKPLRAIQNYFLSLLKIKVLYWHWRFHEHPRNLPLCKSSFIVEKNDCLKAVHWKLLWGAKNGSSVASLHDFM